MYIDIVFLCIDNTPYQCQNMKYLNQFHELKYHSSCISYLYRFSGISEETLRNESRTIRDVQAVLLSMFNSKTVLIGHSLESDLKVLKLIHDVVVDTSILFPHKMGPPKKRALKTLCIENLKKIIQEDGKVQLIYVIQFKYVKNIVEFIYRGWSQQC